MYQQRPAQMINTRMPNPQVYQRNPQAYQRNPQRNPQIYQRQPRINPYRERNIPQFAQNNQQPYVAPRIYQPQQPQQVQAQTYDGLPYPPGTKNQFILYYSNYCGNCKEFMNNLCKTEYYQRFVKIDITSSSNRPKFIKFTPTIVVPEIPKPLIGEDAFNWLEKMSEEKEKEKPEGVQPYHPMEMGSSTDAYSYLGTEDTEQPMEHSFVFIKREEEKINTPQKRDFENNLKPVRGDTGMSNRAPLPQMPQMTLPENQVGMARKMSNVPVPQSSNNEGDKESVKQAYEDLLNRRRIEVAPVRQG